MTCARAILSRIRRVAHIEVHEGFVSSKLPIVFLSHAATLLEGPVMT